MNTSDKVKEIYEEHGSEFMDSLDLIEYRMALEEEFDVDVPETAEVNDFESTVVLIDELQNL